MTKVPDLRACTDLYTIIYVARFMDEIIRHAFLRLCKLVATLVALTPEYTTEVVTTCLLATDEHIHPSARWEPYGSRMSTRWKGEPLQSQNRVPLVFLHTRAYVN